MPELPEVETVVRDLRAAVVGRRVVEVALLRPSVVRYPDGDSFVGLLGGARIEAVRRRGKFIQIALQNHGGAALVVHLGMTGRLDLVAAGTEPRPHTHLRCLLDCSRRRWLHRVRS